MFLSEACDHVSHQIPNNCKILGYLDGRTDSKDSDVISAQASIHQDNTGMCENFELAAIFLVPTYPVVKKKGNKQVAFDTTIYATYGKKYGRGKTGV